MPLGKAVQGGVARRDQLEKLAHTREHRLFGRHRHLEPDAQVFGNVRGLAGAFLSGRGLLRGDSDRPQSNEDAAEPDSESSAA